METQQVQETLRKNIIIRTKNIGRKKNKRDNENHKRLYHTDPLFKANLKDYLFNRYWNEPEFREKALARVKAQRDNGKTIEKR